MLHYEISEKNGIAILYCDVKKKRIIKSFHSFTLPLTFHLRTHKSTLIKYTMQYVYNYAHRLKLSPYEIITGELYVVIPMRNVSIECEILKFYVLILQ